MNTLVAKTLSFEPLHPSEETAGAPVGERFDLVESLPVTLTVTLGSAELTVSRLFALAPGAVLALDRSVDAPVDVRLGDKLVARGQLVAVGDQFGVRISELARG